MQDSSISSGCSPLLSERVSLDVRRSKPTPSEQEQRSGFCQGGDLLSQPRRTRTTHPSLRKRLSELQPLEHACCWEPRMNSRGSSLQDKPSDVGPTLIAGPHRSRRQSDLSTSRCLWQSGCCLVSTRSSLLPLTTLKPGDGTSEATSHAVL